MGCHAYSILAVRELPAGVALAQQTRMDEFFTKGEKRGESVAGGGVSVWVCGGGGVVCVCVGVWWVAVVVVV